MSLMACLQDRSPLMNERVWTPSTSGSGAPKGSWGTLSAVKQPVAAPAHKLLHDSRFELLATLSHDIPAPVATLMYDFDASGEMLADAFAELILWDIGLVFYGRGIDSAEFVAIDAASWPRAKLMAEAYWERTYP
jgi:hypothetical protein